MGKRNVVLWDGTVKSVDDDTAKLTEQSGTAREESAGENLARSQSEERSKRTAGAKETLLAAYDGALDTLTFGGYGKLADAADSPEVIEQRRERAQDHPYARMGGELAGFVVPGSEFAAPGLAIDAGGAAAKLAGGGAGTARLAEGALLGAGSAIGNTNVTGDPLTIEGVLEGTGTGALLNFGAGVIADKISGTTKATAEAIASKTADQELYSKAISKTPDSWTAFSEAHNAERQALEQANREATKVNEAYEKWTSSPKKVNSAIDGFRDAQNDLRIRVQESVFGTDSRAAIDAGQQEDLYAVMADLRKSTETARALAAKGDADGAAVVLRAAKARANGVVPDLELPGIPAPPREIVPLDLAQAPKDLKAFAGMRKPTIAKLANSMDEASAGALSRVMDDLGLSKLATPGETLDALHTKLSDMFSRAAAAETDEAQGLLGWARKATNRAIKYGVARTVDTGGFMGAISRTAAGEATGKALGAVEDAFLGRTFLEGKLGLADKIKKVIAANGESVASGIDELGPVTAALSKSFPSGKHDPEADIRKLALNRASEFQAAQQWAPDALFNALSDLAGHPGDVLWKFHSMVINGIRHLAMTSPKDPGTDTKMFVSDYLPNMADAIAYAHRIEAVTDPLKAVARSVSGDGHPAAAESLKATWPATMQEVLTTAAMSPKMNELTYERAGAMSDTFGAPMSGLQEPTIALALQGMYLPRSSPQMPRGRAPRPTGRPAAVNSSVAGSNVQALISQ